MCVVYYTVHCLWDIMAEPSSRQMRELSMITIGSPW